jgi:uncharacterized protein (TIGR03118 family)
MSHRSRSVKAVAVVAGLIAPPALAGVPLSDAQLGAASAGSEFTIANRVSDQSGVAPLTDPNLVNAWGLSQASPASPLWVANNGSNTSTIYTQPDFKKAPLTVNVPNAPTGTTFIGIPDKFNISANGKMSNTLFAFATEGGQIEAWSPNVDPQNALVAFDGSDKGSEFKGLTLGSVTRTKFVLPDFANRFGGVKVEQVSRPLLFATDFGRNQIDVFNSKFHEVKSFTDPFGPQGYSPFNVQNLDGQIYVTFARRMPGDHDETAGPGLGFVDVFDPSGHFLRRLTTGGPLNAPWGLAIAPQSFGKFAGALLVGNFGDGKINAFDRGTGQFLGQLDLGTPGDSIDGLWALRTGPNGTITFSAGPDGENHGLVGSIGPQSQMWGGQEVVSMAEMHH